MLYNFRRICKFDPRRSSDYLLTDTVIAFVNVFIDKRLFVNRFKNFPPKRNKINKNDGIVIEDIVLPLDFNQRGDVT